MAATKTVLSERQQQEKLFAFVGQVDRLKSLENERTRIFETPSRGGIYHEPDSPAITLVEDRDDAVVVSMGVTRRIEEQKRDLQNALREMLAGGMHKTDLVLHLGSQSVVVADFVKRMCEKLDVPVPE